MNCIDYRLQMMPFLKHELGSKKTQKLLSHVEECSECKEELKAQFFVMEGMKRLEYGGTFNLEEDFEKSLKSSLKEHGRRERVANLSASFLYCGCAIVIFFLLKEILF